MSIWQLWAFPLLLQAILHDIHFSDDWIFKRLKDVYEFQPDYALFKYSSLGEKICSRAFRGAAAALHLWPVVSVIVRERDREKHWRIQ